MQRQRRPRWRDLLSAVLLVAAAVLVVAGAWYLAPAASRSPWDAVGAPPRQADPGQGTDESSVGVVAVGDVANSNGLDDKVAQVAAGLTPDALLLLGDIAYPDGSPSDFADYFAPDWARFASIWMPVPGNHEYQTAGAGGYRAYFGVPPGPLYSSRQVGAWRILGLDSEALDDEGQIRWVRSQLQGHDGQPTLVMWHRPRYSSGQHGDQTDTQVLWDAIKDDPDVQLVLWGHDHDYERMAVPVAGRAPITAMVVGTGGGELRPTPSMVQRPWRQYYVDQVTGVLRLQLSSTSFAWSFVTTDGQNLDAGSQTLAATTVPAAQPATPAIPAIPATPVTRTASVKVRAVKARSRLSVNVNPNRGRGYWTFTVQAKRADRRWAPFGTYRTKGSKETRTLNLGRGTYRVRVRAKHGYAGVTSEPVSLRR
ncbi:MAG TPA: metallophosphoesterase [Candidatus Nanopelagicales bacterium]